MRVGKGVRVFCWGSFLIINLGKLIGSEAQKALKAQFRMGGYRIGLVHWQLSFFTIPQVQIQPCPSEGKQMKASIQW